MLRFPENVPIWLLLSNHILSVWLLSNQDPTVLITWINHLSIEFIHDNITFDISSFSSWIKHLCLCLACAQQFRAAHILQLPLKHFSPPNRTQIFFVCGGITFSTIGLHSPSDVLPSLISSLPESWEDKEIMLVELMHDNSGMLSTVPVLRWIL